MLADKKIMKHLLDKLFADKEREQVYPPYYLNQIYKMQRKFGSKFCDFDKRSNLAEYAHWCSEWGWCIFDELSEVLGWLPWKHWKDYSAYTPEKVEVQFELIDILHFAVSLNMTADVRPAHIMEYVEAKEDTLPAILVAIKGSFMLSTGIDLPIIKEEDRYFQTKMAIARINDEVAWLQDKESLLEKTDITSTSQIIKVEELRKKVAVRALEIFRQLVVLLLLWDMSAEDIWNYYAAKNKENHDRQKRGYAETNIVLGPE